MNSPHRFTRKNLLDKTFVHKNTKRFIKIRNTVKFILIKDRETNTYYLEDIQNYEAITLTQEQVREYELAIDKASDFNDTCTQLFI